MDAVGSPVCISNIPCEYDVLSQHSNSLLSAKDFKCSTCHLRVCCTSTNTLPSFLYKLYSIVLAQSVKFQGQVYRTTLNLDMKYKFRCSSDHI